LSCYFIFMYILALSWYIHRNCFVQKFIFLFPFYFSAKNGRYYGQNTVMVAFQLEAPMLYTSSVVAHIECNSPHAEYASAREYLPKWLLALRRRQWRRRRRRQRERRRSFRSGVHTSDHACISSTRGSSQHVAHEQLCTQSSRSRTAWGNLERPFRAVRTKGEDVLSFYLSFLAFRFFFSLVSCQRCRHVTFTDVPDSFFIFRSRECELRRNWMWKFSQVFFLTL